MTNRKNAEALSELDRMPRPNGGQHPVMVVEHPRLNIRIDRVYCDF